MITPSNRFPDALLDDLRNAGNPLADTVLDALCETGDVGATNRLLRDLARTGGALPEALPDVVRAFLACTAPPADVDREKLRRAEAIFALHGPAMLAVLGLYSLPASYAAQKGVQVLHRTGYLMDQPAKRLGETAQLVVDVLAPGGLDPEGPGVRSAQKVRLVHAAVRRLATRDAARPWDDALGVPINQEDLAGTLMTFSYVVLEGLQRLGVQLREADREAYLYTWVVAGRVLGIDERLLPADMAEAEALTAAIRRRQIAPSAEGRALTAALVRSLEEMMPFRAPGLVAGAIRYFLGRDALQGQDVAALIGLPEERLPTGLVAAAARTFGLGQKVAGRVPAAVSALVSRSIVKALLAADIGGPRTPFTIPETLRAGRRSVPSPARDEGASKCPFHRALGLATARAAA
ncbi:MAG: oxygenase MpaB family protein [Minicystis sp.]